MSSGGKTGLLAVQIIESLLAPAIAGMDPRLNVDCWNRMYGAAPRRAGDGLIRHCMAAVDFALWDLKGHAMGVPVSHLLGGHRELVPTYANCAHHLPVDELAVRAAE